MTDTLDIVLKDAKDGDEFVDDKKNFWSFERLRYSSVISSYDEDGNSIKFTDGDWPYICIPGLRPKPKEKQKKIVRMAPAVIKKPADGTHITQYLFSSEENAQMYCGIEGFKLVSWPAVPDKDGFYSVEVEE